MAVFRGIGQVVMRSGWGPDTPAAAIKFRQNRGHLDIGTFYLFGSGQPTLIDSGSTSYGTPIYDDYSSQSIAHNLVLVDNKPQVRADGQLLAAVGTSRSDCRFGPTGGGLSRRAEVVDARPAHAARRIGRRAGSAGRQRAASV